MFRTFSENVQTFPNISEHGPDVFLTFSEHFRTFPNIFRTCPNIFRTFSEHVPNIFQHVQPASAYVSRSLAMFESYKTFPNISEHCRGWAGHPQAFPIIAKNFSTLLGSTGPGEAGPGRRRL